MKSKLFTVLTVLVLLLTMLIPVSAADAETTEFVPVDRKLPLVVDKADVLTYEEEVLLTERLTGLGDEHKLQVAVVTVDSNEGKSPQAFADDFYDYNGYGYGENDDGLVVVFNTGEVDGNRNLWISTHGTAIELLSDSEINYILDEMITSLLIGEYSSAFDVFVDECAKAVDTSVPLYYIPLSIVIGLIIAFIITKIQASGLNTVRAQHDASDYVGNVELTQKYDNFMYRDVKKTPRPKSNSGSSHTSSSGRSHGGGGKSF